MNLNLQSLSLCRKKKINDLDGAAIKRMGPKPFAGLPEQRDPIEVPFDERSDLSVRRPAIQV